MNWIIFRKLLDLHKDFKIDKINGLANNNVIGKHITIAVDLFVLLCKFSWEND